MYWPTFKNWRENEPRGDKSTRNKNKRRQTELQPTRRQAG